MDSANLKKTSSLTFDIFQIIMKAQAQVGLYDTKNWKLYYLKHNYFYVKNMR